MDRLKNECMLGPVLIAVLLVGIAHWGGALWSAFSKIVTMIVARDAVSIFPSPLFDVRLHVIFTPN